MRPYYAVSLWLRSLREMKTRYSENQGRFITRKRIEERITYLDGHRG